MNYTHLTQKERYQIYALLCEGFSKRHIAFRLRRAPSTITREIKRNRNRNGYFTKHAHKLACERIKSNPTLITPNLWYDVEKYLNLQWSPEQISSQIGVSFTSIYRCIQKDKIAGGFFYTHLRFLNQRKRKYGHPETRGQISNRKNIRKRSDLNHYTNEYIAEITYRLNQRPRKRLGFRSPSQVLWQEHGVALHSKSRFLKRASIKNLL